MRLETASGHQFSGSNMHCSVGFAILVKVEPIWDCFDGGTQWVSMVGTPVSLIPRSSAVAEVDVFDRCGGMIVQAAADGFGMGPASLHMGGALAHEFAARIRNLEQRAELHRLQSDDRAGLEAAGPASWAEPDQREGRRRWKRS